jgi:hypothetical protein
MMAENRGRESPFFGIPVHLDCLNTERNLEDAGAWHTHGGDALRRGGEVSQ